MTSPRTPRRFGSREPITPGRDDANGANSASPLGLGQPPGRQGGSGGERYTSLSSLMRSPDPASPTGRNGASGWRLPITEGVVVHDSNGNGVAHNRGREKQRLSLWRLMALTVSMGGSQIAWTVELGYGTPYLRDLGMSESMTSLVWLAGPISGLVVQPLIGAISDSSTSRYRRRYWVVASTVLLVLSGLGLAFTEPVAKAIVDLFGGGQGDWDPNTGAMVRELAIAIAIFCFYCLDFALNGLQASLRNLVFDVTPSDQLNSANVWNGRFNHLGNIVGFTMGYMNLNNVWGLKWLGGDQFRKLCVLSLILLVITVWITCHFIEEDERATHFHRRSKLRDILATIKEAIVTLPKPVRRICMVQIAAFMGWFPFLFYATYYVINVMAYELGHEPDLTVATRAGSFALLIYSFVAIIAGTVLPWFSERDPRLVGATYDDDSADEDETLDSEFARDRAHQAEVERVREMVRQWKLEVVRDGKELKLPRMPFLLRNIWTWALVLFFVLMMGTFAVQKVWQATILISLVGICWAVACWVPFAMIMEFLKELEQPGANGTNGAATDDRPAHGRSSSLGPAFRPGQNSTLSETTPLMRSYSTADLEGASMEFAGQGSVAGGTIMGIHNLAIVFPQFIVALVASVIFRVADGDAGDSAPAFDEVFKAKTGVAWVLRFGGLMALVGAVICRQVPPTKTEKIMRRRLAEIREEIGE
ncbi:General alpha-glucoside permease [Vanrija pseudolonga]|uniref:General alpha-glucoside permease n=1 Tax=Vanrija pseudolonga TaxID=143232 RepID=A0AAF1BFY4_9TREE|nr:General alpha-glucoside permease [Vanrija pseudolonga]